MRRKDPRERFMEALMRQGIGEEDARVFAEKWFSEWQYGLARYRKRLIKKCLEVMKKKRCEC